MKNVLKTVYELDEVKEKAIEKNRYINVDFDEWHDFCIEEWKENLEKAGFSDSKICYSGFYSQGDGACFDCACFDISRLMENLEFTDEEKARILEIQDEFSISIEKNGHANYYSHEKTRFLNIDCFYIENESDENLLFKLEEQLEQLRLDFCYKIYKDLNDEFDYLTSDSAVYDTLQANEYFFEENGEIFSDYRVLEG